MLSEALLEAERDILARWVNLDALRQEREGNNAARAQRGKSCRFVKKRRLKPLGDDKTDRGRKRKIRHTQEASTGRAGDMEKLGSIVEAERLLLARFSGLLNALKNRVPRHVDSIGEGVKILSRIRESAYEELNQVQHAALLVAAAKWLQKNIIKQGSAEWHWNPHQTGGCDQPDLLCEIQSKVIVAEATASKTPQGNIDKRMKSTLEKLSSIPGEKFYFVKTEKMRQRAETKIKKAGWIIRVVVLE